MDPIQEPGEVTRTMEALDRLQEFREATDEELADAIRLAAGIFPRPMSRVAAEKRARLLETITFLIRQ